MLLLVWNTMWGEDPRPLAAHLPAGWEISTDRERFAEAAAVIFHLPDLRAETPLSKVPGQLWVAWSMECEVHYPYQRDPAFLRHFDLTMTHRRDADVWTPYCHPGLFEELRAPPAEKTAEVPVAAFISSSFDRSGRVLLLEGFMRHLQVHSFGQRCRNRELAHDAGRSTRLETMARYRFTLAFENAVAEDYVTEKFYEPLIAGSVPVYLGAPNAAAFAPAEGCFIDASEFASPAALAGRLRELAADEAAYRELLAWKEQPFRQEFLAMLDAVRDHPISRLCRLVEKAQTARKGQSREPGARLG